MAGDDLTECFYCGCITTRSTRQNDHFPVPKRCRGIETVVSCLSCHDMKDRIPLDRWSMSWIERIARQEMTWPVEAKRFAASMTRDSMIELMLRGLNDMPRESKILFAKAFSVFPEGEATDER